MELIPIITKALVFTIGLFLVVVIVSYFISTIKKKNKKDDIVRQREELRRDLNAFYMNQYHKSRQQNNEVSLQSSQNYSTNTGSATMASSQQSVKTAMPKETSFKTNYTQRPVKKYVAQPRYAVLNDGITSSDPYTHQEYKKQYQDEIGWSES